MAARSGRPGGGRRLRSWVAGGLAGALMVTLAVVAQGYDSREIPREESAVWVARDSGQYARVNTETNELDTVRLIDEPSAVFQAGRNSLLFSAGLSRAWPIDPAAPGDLSAEPAAAEPGGDAEPAGGDGAGPGAGEGAAEATPSGTRELIGAGAFFALRTEAGEVFLGSGEAAGFGEGAPLAGRVTGAARVTPVAGEPDPARGEADQPAEPAPGSVADAIALDADGSLALFSRAEGVLRRYDGVRGEFLGGPIALPEGVAAVERPQLALVDGGWALFDPATGRLWQQGAAAPTVLELTGEALLQASGPGLDGAALVADAGGLWGAAPGEAGERLASASGAPARPERVGGSTYAAWLDAESGQLWSSGAEGLRELRYDASLEAGARTLVPVIESNGSRGVLSERGTGMLWSLPAGSPIPLSQWTLADPPQEESGTVVVEDVAEQLPPVAVADDFGVRAGEQAELPVLLNDFDPNRRDVLTIVPDSIEAGVSPAEFGELQLLPDEQGLSIRVGQVSGSASFSYRITDGVHVSEPATVRLTVREEDHNSAPVWCGVEGCQREWPSPELAPGGTLTLPVLSGWVDPEGDPLFLAGAVPADPADPIRVVATADGVLAVRHSDPNAAEGSVAVEVTVRDSRGEEQRKTLAVAITRGARIQVESGAASVPIGEAVTLRPLERVSGGSGAFQLVDAVLPQGGGELRVSPQPATGAIEVLAESAGGGVLQITVRDTESGAEQSGVIRVTASERRPGLALPPMRAFLRPQQDAVVTVLDALPESDDRVLLVGEPRVLDGELSAQLIAHEQLRIAGGTADGGPGRVGSIDVPVSDQDGASATGRLTVFQVPEVSESGVIAVADSAQVRAGSVVDVRVLENDVSPSGERPALRPEVRGSGAAGELAFASGNTLRYLAPSEPGTYVVGYSVFLENAPEQSDEGRLTVTVLPRGANRDPAPATLTARVVPGQSARVAVPLSGVDPDGDRVRLVGVSTAQDGRVAATMSRRGDELIVEAAAEAKPGLVTLEYRVRDGVGGEGVGALRVAVVGAGEADSAPIAMGDAVRLERDHPKPVTIEPLRNDIDPSQGPLELVSVVPNVPGGEQDEEYRRLAELIDLAELREGRVRVWAGEESGSRSYRYTVRSTRSSSTAEGLIVVRVSDRVGAHAPRVLDTTLTARDRAELATTGVDVVTDRVRWAAGDPATLRLSVWGPAAERFRAEGPRLIGEYRAEGELVPFKLSGSDDAGAPVVAYGFLTVPPLDEIRLTLRPGLQAIPVDENGSARIALADLVERVPGDRIELKAGELPTQRSAASCSASGAELRYSAGTGAPWQDRCLIEARLEGQRTWTRLSVPIVVVPKEPSVVLRSVTRTVQPGEEETVDLFADLASWQGGRAGSAEALRFTVSAAGPQFEVSQSGGTLRIRARADAAPGSEQQLTIEATGAGESRATLTLRVGVPARDTPRGATVSRQCTVGDAGCRITVVGVDGEFDPFAGKPGGGLVLDSVGSAGCRFASFSRAGTGAVDVAWPAGQNSGGTCTVPFTVRDAQGRLGEGSIEFDAQGLPAAPASIETVDYSGSGVSLLVVLGPAQSAHPEVTGVSLSQDGEPARASCSAAGPGSYRCEVGGLENGAKHRFAARATNGVGSSPETSAVESWAYRAPEIASLAAAPVYREGITSETQGVAELTITAGSDARAFRVEGSDREVPSSGATTVTDAILGVGAQTVRVTPLSVFEPPISGGSSAGGPGSAPVTIAGLPRVNGAVAVTSDGGSALQAGGVTANANGSDRGTAVVYRISQPGGEPAACVADRRGGLVPAPGDSASGAFGDLPRYEAFRVNACLTNGFGVAQATGPVTVTGGQPPAPRIEAGFAISERAQLIDAGSYAYPLRSGPSVIANPGMRLEYGNGAGWSADFAPHPDFRGAQVRQCLDRGGQALCSEPVPLPATGAPTTVTVRGFPECVTLPEPGGPRTWPTISAAAAGAATVGPAVPLPGSPGRATVTISWENSDFSGLRPLTHELPVCGP